MPPKPRQKHIIKDDNDESKEEQDVEPPVPVLSSKGKEKVAKDDMSGEDLEDINKELEVYASKITQTVVEKKSLLDIIAEITAEGSAAADPAPIVPHQTPIKSLD